MHARKHSRLNDGYADRKETHLHQDMSYSSGLFANDSDDDRPIGSRASPRYQNKHSYIERNKEKRGGLSLAEAKVSHYLATGSLGRPIHIDPAYQIPTEQIDHHQHSHSSTAGAHQDIPHRDRHGNLTSGGSHRDRDYNSHSSKHSDHRSATTSYQHHHHTSATDHQNKGATYPQTGDRDPNAHQQHTEKDKLVANNNGRQSSTGKDKEQVQKSAIRVCGDWSEHISSSGKRYYYNCKTEVSQWEKPKEWIAEMCKMPTKDARPKAVVSTNKTNEVRANRHSVEQLERPPPHRGNHIDEPQHVRESTAVMRNDSQHHSNRDYIRDNSRQDNANARDSHKSNIDNRGRNDCSAINSHHTTHGGMQRQSSTPGSEDPSHIDYKRETHGDYKKSGVIESSRRRRADSLSQRFQDTGQIPVDDMEISPSPSLSPSSSRPSSVTDIPASSTPLATATTPAHSNSTPGRAPSPQQGNPIPTLVNRQTVQEGTYDKSKNNAKAIQALQELQKALSMHIHRGQGTSSKECERTGPNPVSPHPMGSQHLIYPSGTQGSAVSGNSLSTSSYSQAIQGILGNGDGVVDGNASPVSNGSSQSSCGSPTPSDSSSQNNMSAINSALTAAAMKREETAKLTASLSNYYNEKLIGHVLGWQADGVEKQALKLWEDSVMMGSHQCSKVSVELKRARSQVRIAEIQSTLHEQRIMSSDQQRQEIDNLKTPSSFLPS